MATERIDFPSADGHTLSARLDSPDHTPRAYALFAHCFTCGKDVKSAARIAAALAAEGIATLRFDFTGLGGSEGDFGNTGFSSNVEDLLAAARFMRESGRPASVLVGHSLGGAAVLAAAGDIPECRAVGVVAAPFEVEHVLKHFGDSVREIESSGEGTVNLAGRPFRIRRSFVEDVRNHDQEARIAGLRRPLLVLHSPVDTVVGVDNARRIFEAAMHPKSFVSLDDADHLLSNPRDAEYAATVIAAWAARYLPAADARGEETPETGKIVVEETGNGRFQHRILSGPHRLLADESVAMGGGDSGPSPYDFLLAGLGACTGMTVRMYARRKGLALKKVRVTLEHDRIHATDCEDCETTEGKLDQITRVVALEGDLSDAERARLLEIADMCPVHRTLTSETRIRTTEER